LDFWISRHRRQGILEWVLDNKLFSKPLRKAFNQPQLFGQRQLMIERMPEALIPLWASLQARKGRLPA
jgi:hypothetical protein